MTCFSNTLLVATVLGAAVRTLHAADAAEAAGRLLVAIFLKQGNHTLDLSICEGSVAILAPGVDIVHVIHERI